MEANQDFPNGVLDDIAVVYVLACLVLMAGSLIALVVRGLRRLWRGTRWATVPALPLPRPLLLLDQVPGFVLLAFFWLCFWPFKAPFWAVRWLRQWANPGERVLPQFDWPKVYRAGVRFTAIANYPLPQHKTRAARLALLGAVCMGLYQLGQLPDYQLNDRSPGVIFWPALWTCAILYVLLRFRRRTLRMKIGMDGIRWRIGWIGRGFVPPEDMAGAVAEVLDVHSKAADEQDDENRRGKKTERIYRIASEVVMHSGFGLRDTRHVAEIHKDRNGLKAKLLQTGVNAALIAFRMEEARLAAEAEAARPLD